MTGADDSYWAVSEIRCPYCAHWWVAVHPVIAAELECPGCAQTFSVTIEAVSAAPQAIREVN